MPRHVWKNVQSDQVLYNAIKKKNGIRVIEVYNILLTSIVYTHNHASRKHAYIILTPLNPTFI